MSCSYVRPPTIGFHSDRSTRFPTGRCANTGRHRVKSYLGSSHCVLQLASQKQTSRHAELRSATGQQAMLLVRRDERHSSILLCPNSLISRRTTDAELWILILRS